jgi:hypothetical protein
MYWLAIPIVAAIVWAFMKVQPAAAGDAPRPRLFIIGDSQACGATGIANPCGSDSSRPCAKSGQTFANFVEVNGVKALVYCKIGAHTSEWGPIVPSLGLKPGDVVLVFLGSNDYDAKPDPAPITKAITAAGASYVWIGPPAIRGRSGAAPAFLAGKLGSAYFDSRTLDLTLADGIHPTPSEFTRWMTTAMTLAQNKLAAA